MDQNRYGKYRELIIHPCVTLKEAMEGENISQEELAKKTGFSAKHVSEIVNGKKGISPSFARKLEYVFPKADAMFWINLQGIYDVEIEKYREVNNISDDEYAIFNKVKDIYNYAISLKMIENNNEKAFQIIDFRKLLNISNLTNIDKLVPDKIIYRKSSKNKIDKDILYSWLKVCEKISNNTNVKTKFSVDLLMDNLIKIKNVMFEKEETIESKLQDIFSKCGIKFNIVKNFKGAPIQGYIREKNNNISLCITLRGKYADIFWFTLFHEIGHILNFDYKDEFMDFYDNDSKEEKKADFFAQSFLIDDEAFNLFIKNNKFSVDDVRKFAETQNVKDYIVIGRLQKELNDYTLLTKYKTTYDWLENV